MENGDYFNPSQNDRAAVLSALRYALAILMALVGLALLWVSIPMGRDAPYAAVPGLALLGLALAAVLARARWAVMLATVVGGLLCCLVLFVLALVGAAIASK